MSPATETTTAPAPMNVHASAIRLNGLGILIRGPARSGKSALALAALRRTEAMGLSAALVSDDQVFLEPVPGVGLDAVAPAATFGLIEISGVGILREAAVARAAIGLLVDLAPPDAIERLPENPAATLCGFLLPRIALPERQASFAADVLASLAKSGPSLDLHQF